MAEEEVENLVADLFGDFSESESQKDAAEASGKRPASEASPSPALTSAGTPPATSSTRAPTAASTPLTTGAATASSTPLSAAAPSPPILTRSSEDGADEPKRQKKRRRTGSTTTPGESSAARFFELEAHEADADSGDDDSVFDDLIDDSAADIPQDQSRQKAELNAVRAEMDAREERGGTVRSSGFLDHMEQKYSRSDSRDEGIAVADIGRSVPSSDARKAKTSTTTFIVPDTAKDPRLWCCKTFAPERELCLSLLLKAGTFLSAGTPCPIFSAFYNPSLRGYIYLEAHKENDIRAFSKGIRGISPWQIRLVPVAQMPQVFSSAVLDADKKDLVKLGEWVRMKRGLYQGDLACIDEIQDQEYTVRLKPRLDYSGASAAPTKKGRTREPDILESKEARKETRKSATSQISPEDEAVG